MPHSGTFEIVPRAINRASDFYYPDLDLTHMGDQSLGHLIPSDIVNPGRSQRGSGRQGYSPMLGPGNGWCNPWYGNPNSYYLPFGYGYGYGYGGYGNNYGCGYGGCWF